MLDIIFDNTLSWWHQSTNTSWKSFAALARIRKCHIYLPRKSRYAIVQALVFPYFDYCASLFLDLSMKLTWQPSKCKNGALRYATGTKRYDLMSPVYLAHSILIFSVRNTYLFLCLVASVLRARVPLYLREMLEYRPIDAPGTKRASNLDIHRNWALFTSYINSFSFADPLL